MVAELCEYCGNKFDSRGIRRHRTKCQKSQQKEEEASEKEKGYAARNMQIRDLFEKVKMMERNIEDLTNQLIKLIKEV
ncbi:MAG: hypothetical protein OIN87_13140 [Candidatus Methanoperedens sp.]|nr:hypothetical protein [Candidatus Methanoperedens sp.]